MDDAERAAYEAAMTENQLLRAVLDDLKGEGCAPRSISNRRKAEFGERLRRETGLPLREITAFLRISKSSYEYQRARLGEDRDAALRGPVREAFEEGRGCYGYRRVNALLRLRGTRVSEKRVRRVMREEGLVAARPRRRRYSSYAGEPDGRPANVPRERAAGGGHDFSAGAPGELAVTDVSELPAAGRKYYLSPVIDCFDGLPASWGLSPHPDSALCDGSLEAYLDSLPGGSSPVVHTDGGGPYRAASELEGDLLAARRHPLDVQARPVRRQRKGRGVLRGAQGGVPLQARLVAREPRGVPGRARGLRRVVPRRQAEAVRGAGRDEALRDHHGPQAQAGACGVGWSKKTSASPPPLNNRKMQAARRAAPGEKLKPDRTMTAFHPADLVFDPTLAHWGLRFGATRPLTRSPLAREAVCLLSNGRCDLPLGRAVLAAGRTPRLTWILWPRLP